MKTLKVFNKPVSNQKRPKVKIIAFWSWFWILGCRDDGAVLLFKQKVIIESFCFPGEAYSDDQSEDLWTTTPERVCYDESVCLQLFLFSTSFSTRFPLVKPFLPLISAPTDFHDWDLVTRRAQLLITSNYYLPSTPKDPSTMRTSAAV